jgi:drug/metabolite transporter (DMT)-like permease
LLTLGCALLFGLHIALLDQVSGRHDPLGLTSAQLLACAVLFAGSWLGRGYASVPPAIVWPAILVTGVFASAGAYLLQTAAQRELRAVTVTLIFALEPAFAALFGWWFAGDRLTAGQLAGGLLMLLASGWAALSLPTKQDTERQPEKLLSSRGSVL